MTNRKHKDCKNCFSNEDFRQELLENCKGRVLVGYCCCEEQQMAKGVLALVGEDFIVLDDPMIIKAGDSSDEKEAKSLIIPLERIVTFIECEAPPTELGCKEECDSDQTMIEHLADEHCGDFVNLQYCPCFGEDPVCIYGNIVEVGCDFVEIRAMLGKHSYKAKPGSAMEEVNKLVKSLVDANAKNQKGSDHGPTKDIVIRAPKICSILVFEEN